MTMKFWYVDIKINSNTFFVFDLDDTLFPEADFLASAYCHISLALSSSIGSDISGKLLEEHGNGRNAFDWLLRTHGHRLDGVDLDWLLKEYRGHLPSIQLAESTSLFLQRARALSVPAGLVTDGRSITQRNKLQALGILELFSDIIISEEFGSEKPDPRNFMHFENNYPGSEFYFFGDNTGKDFITPAALGWKTVCLRDQGRHIHRQDLTREPIPDQVINFFSEIDLV